MRLITYTIITVLLMLSFSGKAQNAFSVKGAVADSAAALKMHNASALVLRAKDSILVKFTRVNQEGNFAINNLPAGKYMLLLSYPEYADYTEPFELDAAHPTHDFGKVNMILKTKLLQDIIIRAKATPIKIKGDTTVFNASAYVVQPNAKVEDLIKQFPGMTVDKDGKISANGQTVSKVLLGGEEFFGDDPTLVTKNIRADMVKEVQMFDKKSDQAAFTGVDDGKKTLTLNVVLKDDKKSGYFGKVDAGVATSDFYSGQLMFNKFANKEKFSVNATLSNNGRTGLSFQDEQKFGDAGNVTVMDGGGIAITISGNDLSYDGRGFPTARSGGVHYDNKWNKDKHSINTNYKIGQLEVDGTANTLTQTNLKDSLVTTNSDEVFRRESFRQKLDATYLITIDTSSTLKVGIDGTIRRSTSAQDFRATAYSDVGFTGVNKILTDQTRTITRETDQQLLNATAFYTKKLKKKGRTFSATLSNNIDNGTEEGYLITNLDTYNTKTGLLKSNEKVDQKKPVTSRSNVFNSNFTYSEPLTKALSLVVNYGLNLSNMKSEKLSFNKSASGQYDVLDKDFSNSFTFNQVGHQAGAILNYVKGKNTLNFGTKIADVQYKQTNDVTGQPFERHFINWMPQLTYQYRIGTQSSFSLYYNGSTRQPTVAQLQPVRDNTNLTFQTIGNPDLRPSFSNSFNFSYNSYKALSGERLYISGSYGFVENQFVSNQTVINGKQTSQTVNMSDKTPYNYNLSATYGRNLLGISVQMGPSMNYSVNYNMVNNSLNQTKSGSYGVNLSFSKYVVNKYDLYISGGPRYQITESSLQQRNSNSTGFNGNAYVGYYLPAKFQLTSEANYTLTGSAPDLPANSRTIVTASLSKMFFKSNALKLTASANDLLNQNTGFNRNINGGNITQNTNSTIRRYFMLAVTWDFNKMGGGTPKN